MNDEPLKHCPRCAAPLEARQHAGRERLTCPRDGWVFWDNPLPVVAGIVEHEGSVVLVRNQGWPEKMFGLVTGFLERGESPEQGVLRELREELGLEGEVARLIGVYPFEQRNELIVAYHVRAHGTIHLGDEIAETKAVAPGKLRPWPFGTGLAVRDWLATR
jgi:NAD+ diphosphatase